MKKKKPQTSCDTCLYFTYDEDYEAYMCDMDMDADEYADVMYDDQYSFQYYRNDNKYAVLTKQM